MAISYRKSNISKEDQMPRWFVYVNTTNKKITFHSEKTKPCPDICKHIKIGGAYSGRFRVGRSRNLKTIRIEGRENDYWLIVWADSMSKAHNHARVKQTIKKENITKPISICKRCK
jgi:hypothetical protein